MSIEQFQVEKSVPTEDKIEWEVKQLRNHRSWGTSCMQAEHIKGWLEEAQKVISQTQDRKSVVFVI